MAGSEAIIKKIIADANESADSILSSAKANAKEVVALAEKEAKATMEKEEVNISKECELVLSRRQTVAELDSRKILLQAKQDLIQEVYVKANEKIMKLPAKNYEAFIMKLLKNNAEEGDVVVLPKDGKITAEFVDKASTELKIKLSSSKEKEEYNGGVILRSNNCDKNLTLDSIFRESKENDIRKVAELLFE